MENKNFGSMKMTRRRLLGTGARLAALAAAASILPPSVRRALAQEAPRKGSLKDIKHVVLLMQENRSFDHYFGTMAGVRGFDDPNAMVLPNGKSIFHQPDPENPNGYLLPFHLDTKKTSAQKIPSTNHSWGCQHDSWNHGKMDDWLPAHRKVEGTKAPYIMGYHTRSDIPFQFALAEAFTICDGYFCSVMGPTWPNRMYWMTGTIDPEGQYGGPLIKNQKIPGGFRWTSYAERLEKAGVSWKIYNQLNSRDPDNKPFNVLQHFTNFQKAAPGSALHSKGLVVDAPDQFEQDARNDKLPTVSWLMSTTKESEHPDHMPAAGADFVARKIEALAANPEVWAKTVFIINYDENDGIFDHVAPPVPPCGPGWRIHKWSSYRRRLPGSLLYCFAVDGRRLGLQPAVRPYVGPAIRRKNHRRHRDEYYPLAASDVRGFDGCFSICGCQIGSGEVARNGRSAREERGKPNKA